MGKGPQPVGSYRPIHGGTGAQPVITQSDLVTASDIAGLQYAQQL